MPRDLSSTPVIRSPSGHVANHVLRVYPYQHRSSHIQDVLEKTVAVFGFGDDLQLMALLEGMVGAPNLNRFRVNRVAI
jgi:hypothetical protein